MKRKKISISREAIEDEEFTPRDLIVYLELLRQKKFVPTETLYEEIEVIMSDVTIRNALNKLVAKGLAKAKKVNTKKNGGYYMYKAIPCLQNCIRIDYEMYLKVKNMVISIDYFYSYLKEMAKGGR